ncbi:MAG: hypothetical protein ABMA64_22870 [Myxococcota bacterium]
MPHELTEHPLPGLDPLRLQQLTDAGVDSLEGLVALGPVRLAEVTGFDLKTCRALIRVARGAMSRTATVVELVPVRDEPASARLTRGLDAARDVERALSLVRKARSHAGRRPAKARWARPHDRARRQLRKLLQRLEVLQQVVLSDGLSQISHLHLTTELERLELALGPLIDRPMRKRDLRQLRRAARRARRGLDA